MQRPWATLLAAVLVNGALFGAFLSTASICYESNDDTSLMQIAAGVETVEPSDRLVFTNVLIGSVLKWLFLANPNINWYTLYLLSTHFLSMTAILFAWLRQHCSISTVCLFGLLFVVFEARLLLQFQFTSTAIVAGWSGFLLLISASAATAKHVRTLSSLIGIGLIVLSSMIREQAFYFSTIVVLPLFIVRWIRGELRPTFAWWAGAMLIAGFTMAYNHSAYRSDEPWRDYVEYNKVRGRLQDYPVVDYTPNTWYFFRRVGWCENDYYAFRNYFADDRNLATPHALKRIMEMFGAARAMRPKWTSNLFERLDLIHAELVMTAANLLLCFAIGAGHRFRACFWAALEAFLISGVFSYLAMYGKLEVRVMLPAVFFTNVLIFFTATTGSKCVPSTARINGGTWPFRPILSLMSSLVIIAVYSSSLFFAARSHAEISEENRVNHAAFQYIFKSVLPKERATEHFHPVCMMWKHDVPYLWDSPFSSLSELADLPTIRLGWNIHSPYLAALLQHFSISDIYQGMIERSDLFLTCNEEDSEHLMELVRDHFQENVHSDTPRYYLYEHSNTCGPRMLRIRQLRRGQISATLDDQNRPPADR